MPWEWHLTRCPTRRQTFRSPHEQGTHRRRSAPSRSDAAIALCIGPVSAALSTAGAPMGVRDRGVLASAGTGNPLIAVIRVDARKQLPAEDVSAEC